MVVLPSLNFGQFSVGPLNTGLKLRVEQPVYLAKDTSTPNF